MGKHAWPMLILAALFEIGWAIGLKHSDSILTYLLTLLCIFLSFYGLIRASETIPTGTAYAVFVGLGSVGVVFSGIAFFGESVSLFKIAFIVLLIFGVIGLKLVSGEKEQGT